MGTWEAKGVQGSASERYVDDCLLPVRHDTDRNILFELLKTMNKTLEVISNDQRSSAQRIGLLESEMSCTREVVENRLKRLEIYNDRQREFNDRQHDYNDRVSRVLEILVVTKGINAASASETRDGKYGEGCDEDGTGELRKGEKKKGRISGEYQTSHHMSPDADGHPTTNNIDARHSDAIISLKGDDSYCRVVGKKHDTEGMIYMQAWDPPLSATPRTLRGIQAGYDPFGPIRRKDFARLRILIERERGLKLGDYTSSSEFYMQLLLDKPRHPGDLYGWLTDTHMCRGMDLFRKRSVETPSPYKSERIAFLDPLICAMWCSHLSEFERNENSILDNYYVEMFKGEFPAYCRTNKVWFRDVDILYIAHFVGNSHWVGVEINLVDWAMIIYDSAPGHREDLTIAKTVRAYETLIAALAKQMGPTEKPMMVEPFVVRRSTPTPLNHKSGDCGIYTLKFIECVALGLPFTGLEDNNIRFIRRKLAVEIMMELTEGSRREASQPYSDFAGDDNGLVNMEIPRIVH